MKTAVVSCRLDSLLAAMLRLRARQRGITPNQWLSEAITEALSLAAAIDRVTAAAVTGEATDE